MSKQLNLVALVLGKVLDMDDEDRIMWGEKKEVKALGVKLVGKGGRRLGKSNVEAVVQALDEERLEKFAKLLGIKPEEFAFPADTSCERRLACEEAGECLGLCVPSGKDDDTAAQAAMLAIAAEKGAVVVGEVLPEEALGDVDPETPIVVVPEPAPLPEPAKVEPAPEPEPEPEPLIFEGRTYVVALTERGLVFTSACGKTKEVLDPFCRWWQKATRRPITGAEGLFGAGNEELMRLLVANRDFLQIGAPRKPTPPPTPPKAPAVESTKAPESAATPAPESAKTEEKPVSQPQSIETYAFNAEAFKTLCDNFVLAGQRLTTLAWKFHDRDLVSARSYLTEMWKRFEWAEGSMNFTNDKLVARLLSLFPISEAEAFDLVIETRKNINPAPIAAPTTEETVVSEQQQSVSTSALTKAPSITEEDARLDAHTNALVSARSYLTEMWKRFEWAEGSANFTNEKVAVRLLSLFPISEAEALDLVVETRKITTTAPESAPVSQPQQQSVSTSAPTEAPTTEEESIVTKPTVETTVPAVGESVIIEETKPVTPPVTPQAPEVTEQEVKAALADLNARYAHTKASDKKIAHARNEALTSINARIKRGEWSRAMEKIAEQRSKVPEVPAAPAAPKAPVVEMPAPKPTTVKGGVTVVQAGIFEKSQPIIPAAEPKKEPVVAPKPVIDVKSEPIPAPSATTQAEQKPAEQKKEAPVAQQPVIETPKADESATTSAASEAVKNEEKKPMNEQTTETKATETATPEAKKVGIWQRCKAWAERFDRRVHFKCGPTKEPEGMDKIPGIIAAANKDVKEGEFVSSTGTGPGITVIRMAAEVIEDAMSKARIEARMNFPVKDQMGTELTLGQLQVMARTRPELDEVVAQASAEFRRQWEMGVAKAVPSIVEKPLNEYLSGKEEGVNRGLILAALIEAFHLRNPVKRDENWKLDPKVVQAATEGVKEENAEKIAKATSKILNGGGATEAKAMLRAMEAATVHLGEVGGKTLPSMEGMENMLKEISDVVLAGSLITTAKVASCTGNEFPGVDTEMVMNAVGDCALAKEFEAMAHAIECQNLVHPTIKERVDSLAGMGDGSLAMERMARIYCLTSGAHNLIAQEGGPEFVRLMIQIRSAKKVESLEKVKGGRGVVRKTTWSIYVAGKWTVLAVVAVVSWAFLPAKVVFYAGKAAAYKVASLFAGKDEGKKAERNAAAGEAWACCVNSAKAIVMRPYGWAKRIVVGGYNKIKGWFGKSADQQTNGTAQAANNKKEGTMGLFTGVLSQKFGEAKGTEFGAQKWYHKAASIAMSPFVAAWRVTKTYTAEVVVAAASAGIAVIVGASALVVGGVAVAGAAVGMAARWIGRKFFGKKDETTTTAPAATTAPAQQAAA